MRADLPIIENSDILMHEKKMIMLAISNLRYSESIIEYVLKLAAEEFRELLILFVNDQDFSNCTLGVGGWFVKEGLPLSDSDELQENDRKNKEKVGDIVRKADLLGIETAVCYTSGDFSLRVLETVNKFNPAVIVTTRRWRYKWQRLIFGSHVDRINEQANCRVIEF